jgi:hypothetical protein
VDAGASEGVDDVDAGAGLVFVTKASATVSSGDVSTLLDNIIKLITIYPCKSAVLLVGCSTMACTIECT